MNLKLQRVTRTPYSEQIAIYDADIRDKNDEIVNIGKLDIHYLEDQITGTLLIWQEYATGFARTHAPGSEVTMDDLIDGVLAEVSQPLGVSSEYGIEVYFPPVAGHQFISNYPEDDTEQKAEGDKGAEDEIERDEDNFAPRLRP